MKAEDYTFTAYAKANSAQRWLGVSFLTKGFDNDVWFDLEGREGGHATLWARTDGIGQATSNVGGVTTAVQL